jgi:uncharacterized protein YlxP (DUF503 family)
MAFVCLLQIDLNFPENGSLKGKRKEVSSLKEQLRHRFGASVSETDHHDLWQRGTLSVALVGGRAATVDDAAAKVERFVLSRFPDGVRVERGLISADELLGS